MGVNLHGTFVSQKVNKVRWKPELGLDSETFITGSWDDKENKLILWLYPPLTGLEEEDESDIYPRVIYKHPHEGDVTEIKFVTASKFLVSSSSGFVQLLEVVDKTRAPNTHFKNIVRWDDLHFFSSGDKSSCTGLATFEEDVATIGEDGRISLLSLHHEKLLRVIDDADSCSLRCTCFLKHNELLTGNLRGHMKVWDLRSANNKPISTFMLSGEQIGASCVAHHPTQRHLVLAGGEDGALTVWDLRQNTFPVTLLSAHTQAVSELQFHPDRPEHVFTCSVSGEVWHWNTASVTRSSAISSGSDLSLLAEENPWLSSDAAKHRMEVFSLMPVISQPINSLDVNHTRLICGCDNEAVYVIRNLVL
ncbi:nucleoporin 43 [Lycorma delicatula]|uniref:nucleoporin 43 n=1 Tax=Lycorma delicatula TaxID=130591 RepID=UPI003F518DC2